MIVKKLTAILTAVFVLAVNMTGCQKNDNITSSQIDFTAEKQEIRLTNFMTDKERKSISVGELTLLSDENNTEVSDSEEHIVKVELWNNQDYLKWTEENKDMFTDDEYQEKIDFYSSNEFTSIIGVVIDGRYYTGMMPFYNYDGGEIAYEGVHFNTFEEFSIWYREYVDKEAEDGYITQAEADQLYEDMLIIFNSVINNTYEIMDESAKNYISEPDFKNKWEFDSDEVIEIKDSVREISIYDEELNTSFIIHVTLPPSFDESKTYPMFVMTDGVWRFGNHPDLIEMMKNGESEDVILVSIGYDFSQDGTDNAVRAQYFCEKKEFFLNFITDNLIPYLNELYRIDFEKSALYGHSLGGVFSHYAAFNSDLYENQPFQYYIIGSPAFWSDYFLSTEDNFNKYKSEYDYFVRNETFDKNVYICGGENEDSDYAEYYGENDTTLEGISNLMNRLENYGVTSAECDIYEESNHYEYIPSMFRKFFLNCYGK